MLGGVKTQLQGLAWCDCLWKKTRSSLALPMGLRGLLELQRLHHRLTKLVGYLG